MPQTDLELVMEYCECCRQFVNPRLLREVISRGLYDIINYLPNNLQEAKAVAYARMAAARKVFGDPETDRIAGLIDRLQFLRKELNTQNMADVHITLPVLTEMQAISNEIQEYYQ